MQVEKLTLRMKYNIEMVQSKTLNPLEVWDTSSHYQYSLVCPTYTIAHRLENKQKLMNCT